MSEWLVVVQTATHSTNWEGRVRLVESEMFELRMLKKNANERRLGPGCGSQWPRQSQKAVVQEVKTKVQWRPPQRTLAGEGIGLGTHILSGCISSHQTTQ